MADGTAGARMPGQIRGRGPADRDAARGESSAPAWRRQHLTVDQRLARGRAARQHVPRSGHGRWEPAPNRPDPITLLEEQAQSRVPELVPIRYGRMLASPFTFYRGAALIMAADLAATPVSGVTVQLCGDAHLLNFGLFGSPERRMLFDINDFDETLPGPWEWDVKRLAASFEVMGRDRGFSPADRRAIVMAGVAEYRDRMRRAARVGGLDAWYDHFEAGMLLKLVRQEVRVKRVSKGEGRAVQDMVAKARTRDSTRVFTKRADEIDGELRIVADPPVIVPIEDLVRPGSEWEDPAPVIKKLLASYRRTLGDQHHPLEEYRYVHTAYKMVGVGSVGTRCYIMLLMGRDTDDPLFLQIKEAQASVLERYAGKSTHRHQGQRVVVGQRLLQAATDIFLGWQHIKGLDGVTRDYYVRQFQDWKGSADVETMLVPGATLYSRICGATLARAHARWGDRIAIASYLGKGDAFDAAIAKFSIAYADQNERDYAAFMSAISSGRLVAQTGVLELHRGQRRAREMATRGRDRRPCTRQARYRGSCWSRFPAARARIFTDPDRYDLSSSSTASCFLPQVITAIAGLLARHTPRSPLRLQACLPGRVDRQSRLHVADLRQPRLHRRHDRRLRALLIAASLGPRLGLTVPALNTFTAAFHPAGGRVARFSRSTPSSASAQRSPRPSSRSSSHSASGGVCRCCRRCCSRAPGRQPRACPLRTRRPPRRARAAGDPGFASCITASPCSTASARRSTELVAARHDERARRLHHRRHGRAHHVLGDGHGRAGPLRRRSEPLPRAVVAYRLLPFVLAVAFLAIAALPDGGSVAGVLTFGLAGLGCSALLP